MADFLFALGSLIVVIGPWKAGIVFAERTRPLPLRTRRLVAVATVVLASAVSALFLLVGADLVEFFHISEAAFLMAAGLLVLVFAIGTVIGEPHEAPTDNAERNEIERDEADLRSQAWRLAAYPLAVPLLVTPPAIATLVALSVQASVSDSTAAALIAAVVVVMAFNLVVFLAEARWEDRVPDVAWVLLGRVLGVLLAGFGMSLLIEGIELSGLVGHGGGSVSETGRTVLVAMLP